MTEAIDNVVYLKGLYQAFANGDVPTVLAAMDEDIEWNEAEGNPYNLSHPFVGTSAVVEGVFADRERHRRLRDPPGAVDRPGGHRRDVGSL
jgi:ketosteroid isomerase-like protein